jgi:hypothetical protein
MNDYETLKKQFDRLNVLYYQCQQERDELRKQVVLLTPLYKEPDRYQEWHNTAMENVQYMIDNDQPIRLGD